MAGLIGGASIGERVFGVKLGALDRPSLGPYPLPMQQGQASVTALGAAGHRAAHQVLERGLVFADPLALAILGQDADGAIALNGGTLVLDNNGGASSTFEIGRRRVAPPGPPSFADFRNSAARGRCAGGLFGNSRARAGPDQSRSADGH